jgi:hypothetical protein
VVAVALDVVVLVVALAVLGLAGGAPVPVDDGGDAAAGELGDVAGLAGDALHMVVELEAGQRVHRVWCRPWQDSQVATSVRWPGLPVPSVSLETTL